LNWIAEKIGNAIAARMTDDPFASEYDLKSRVVSVQKDGTHIVGEGWSIQLVRKET